MRTSPFYPKKGQHGSFTNSKEGGQRKHYYCIFFRQTVYISAQTAQPAEAPAPRQPQTKLSILIFIDCSLPQLVGNFFCDDITNSPECDFDGGDCCSTQSFQYPCLECICYVNDTATENGRKIII